MAHIMFKGNPVATVGNLPAVGAQAPDFVLTKGDLSDVSLKDFAGKKKILNIVHSLDTSTCAKSAKAFNEKIAAYQDTVVLNISSDLPFAQKRFCEANDLAQIVPLSQMRDRQFGQDYGVTYTNGPLKGILSRAIVVLDQNNKVLHVEQVQESTLEPDYEKALNALR